MSYPLIINTLREFGLITEQQFRDAYLVYMQEEQQIRAAEDAHRAAFYARWETRPWWRKKLSLGKEYEWGQAWSRLPFELRFPQWAKEQQLLDSILGPQHQQ